MDIKAAINQYGAAAVHAAAYRPHSQTGASRIRGQEQKMSTRTITIEEISSLSKEGRIAARSSAEYGQTAVGAHCAISAERRVVIDVSPTGVGYEDGTNLTIYPAREAGEGRVFLDPKTGRVWCGSMTTLRILSSSEDPLESGTIIKDHANAAWQRALMHGAA